MHNKNLFDKTHLKSLAIAGIISVTAITAAVPSVSVFASEVSTQSESQADSASEMSEEKTSEKDDPAAGDVGDTANYNAEKTKRNSIEESSEKTRSDSDIDLSTRNYPETTDIITCDSYYNLGDLNAYGQYLNLTFDAPKDDVSRLQVIYTGSSPEVVFFDPQKNIYAGSNKTYENGFSIVKKTNDDYMTIGITDYHMDVYYVEYPDVTGTWVAQLSTVGMKEIVFNKTALPESWQNLSASKEVAAETDGPAYYSLTDSSSLVTLVDASENFNVDDNGKDKIQEVKEDESTDYTSLILGGTLLVAAVVGFFVFKHKSNKKIQLEEDKKRKERELAEYKESRKKTAEQIEEELTEKFKNTGEDWSDAAVDWDTKPSVIEVHEEKRESHAIKKRVNQIKEINAEYTNTVLQNAEKTVTEKEKTDEPVYDEKENVILNPVIPDMSNNDNDDLF